MMEPELIGEGLAAFNQAKAGYRDSRPLFMTQSHS